MTDLEQAALLRRELAQLHEQEPGQFWLLVSQDEALDIASGSVPLAVQAMARMICEDVDAVLRRNANKPVQDRRETPGLMTLPLFSGLDTEEG